MVIEIKSHQSESVLVTTQKMKFSVEEYFKDIINNLRKSDTWKTQLTIAVNFASSEDMMKSVKCIQRVIT